MSHNWQNIQISPEATIKEAIEIIDAEALRIALVVDESHHLLGTVTDGDIRRALIKGSSLDSAVDIIMNPTPQVVEYGTSREQIRQIMEHYDLLSVPIVKDGVIVGLETLRSIVQRQSYDNPIFIMAGGFGSRLRPLTDNCPKPLLKVGDKPILETIIENFVRAGFHRFYISTHYLPEMIMDYCGDGKKWGASIEYVYEEEPLGTGGALGLLPDNVPKLPMIMMNGDVLTKVDFEHLLAYHNELNPIATMCVREYEYQVPFGVIQSEDHKITGIMEKPIQKHFVNAGIYILSPEFVASVEKNTNIDMPSLLNSFISADKPVSMFPIHEYWLDIGRPADFNKAQEFNNGQ